MRNSSLLNIGSECMYFLCRNDSETVIPNRCIRGIPMNFEVEEVQLSEG